MTGALASIIRRYRRQMLILMPVLVGTAILETVTIAALYPLLSVALDVDAAGNGGAVLGAVSGLVAAFPPDQRMLAAIALFLALVPLDIGGKFLREWLQVRVSARVTYDMKQRVFARMLTAPHGFFLARKHGDLVYRLSTAPANLALALLLVAMIAGLAATSAMTVILLVTIEWRSTIVMLVLGALYFLANRYIARTHSVRAGRARQTAQAAELGTVNDFLVGAKEIAVTGSGPAWARRFASQSDAYRRSYVREYVAAISPGLLLELLVLVAAGSVVAALKILSPDTLLTLLPLVAVYAYATRHLLGFLGTISRQALRVAALAPDVALLERALTEEYPPVRQGRRTAVPDWSEIRLDGVTFPYPGTADSVLDDVSFAIARRGTTAIVGRSGVGKSTVLYLLLRLFDPLRGEVLLDGVPISQWDRTAWLRQIGYVGQEPFLYNASVAENVAFGRDVSAADIERAAREANADEFVRDLPAGYDTVLADRGQSLSAGQRQRLAIARALVGRPRLLLLDEVTSALDAESERLVQTTLEDLARRTAVVLVAHSLSFVRAADRIVVLESGRVAEQGRHADLLRLDGAYARLVRTQREEALT